MTKQKMTAEQLLDGLADLLAPRLAERGFELKEGGAPTSISSPSPDYDKPTCERFLEGEHLGDSVLQRAQVFFGELADHGEISSLDLVEALGLKGPKSLPFNLTNPLKKSARRLGIDEPWAEDEVETPSGPRTVWRDRDGIAARMVEAIWEEWEEREPSPWNPRKRTA